MKIKKTMIYLDEDEHTRLKYLALDERVSMAELIRRAVREYLKQQPRKAVRK
jgi:predicted HicB family RNase H-like nuclease